MMKCWKLTKIKRYCKKRKRNTEEIQYSWKCIYTNIHTQSFMVIIANGKGFMNKDTTIPKGPVAMKTLNKKQIQKIDWDT